MKQREKDYSAFSKELQESLDCLGYEWSITGKNITLNLSKPNKQSRKFKERSDQFKLLFDHKVSPKSRQKLEKHLHIMLSRLTFYKARYSLPNLIYYIIIVACFSIALPGFISFIPASLPFVPISAIIIILSIGAILSALNDMRYDDRELFKRKLKLAGEGIYLYSSIETPIKRLIREKIIAIVFGGFFLIMTLMAYIWNLPALIYFNEVVNFTGLLIVTIYMLTIIFTNKMLEIVSSDRYAHFLAALFMLVFFIFTCSAILLNGPFHFTCWI